MSSLWKTALGGASQKLGMGGAQASSPESKPRSLWGGLSKNLSKATGGMQSPASPGVSSLLSSPSPAPMSSASGLMSGFPKRSGTSDLAALIRKAQAQKNEALSDPTSAAQDSAASPGASNLLAVQKAAALLMGGKSSGLGAMPSG